MTKKLKNGFFRVQPYSEISLLTGDWFAFESDNTYEIYNGSTRKETYSATSKGMGRIIAVFGSEYFIYHNGGSQIRWWNQSGKSGVLLNLSGTSHSLVCYDKNFVVLTHSGNTITAKAYVITGINSAPVATLITTAQISVSADTIEPMCSARANETDAYVLSVYSGSGSSLVHQSLKLVNNTSFSPSLTLSWQFGRIDAMPIPVAGAWVYMKSPLQAFWTPRMKYYMTETFVSNPASKTIAIYRVSDNRKMFEHTYTSATLSSLVVRVYIDQDTGNGYITTTETDSANIIGRVYRLNNWTQTQIVQASGGIAHAYYTSTDGLFPLCNNKLPSITLCYGSVYNKVNFTTSAVSIGTPTQTNWQDFASMVRWA